MSFYVPSSRPAACPECHRVNVLVDAITTTAASLFCLACANLFAVDPSAGPGGTRMDWSSQATMVPVRGAGLPIADRGPRHLPASPAQGGAPKRV